MVQRVSDTVLPPTKFKHKLFSPCLLRLYVAFDKLASRTSMLSTAPLYLGKLSLNSLSLRRSKIKIGEVRSEDPRAHKHKNNHPEGSLKRYV